MTVTGIIINPAMVLATAPVTRFAVLDSFGRAEEPWLAVVPPELAATPCLRAFKLEKYSAEPKPVRRADGMVPRQRPRNGCGEERIALSVGRREWCRDCWTRVLRRSA